jgi:hypothetical protein
MMDQRALECQRQHLKDLLQQAEQEHLVREALAGHPAGPRLHDRALAWLGRCLIAWGKRLEARSNPSPLLREADLSS